MARQSKRQTNTLLYVKPITEDERDYAIRCVRRTAGENSDEILEQLGLLEEVDPQ